MNITKVSILKGDWGKTKAMASVTLDSCFVVTGFKVIDGSKGLFVSMPNRKGKEGEKYIDTAFPTTKEFRQTLIDALLTEYGEKPKEEKKDGFVPVSDSMYCDDDLPF